MTPQQLPSTGTAAHGSGCGNYNTASSSSFHWASRVSGCSGGQGGPHGGEVVIAPGPTEASTAGVVIEAISIHVNVDRL